MTDSGAGCYKLMCEHQIFDRQDLARYLRKNKVLGVKDKPSDEDKRVLECWRLNRKCDEKDRIDPRGSRPTQANPPSPRQSSQAKPPSPSGQSQRTNPPSPRQSSQANPPSPRQSSQANPPSPRQSSQAKPPSPRQSSQAKPPSSRGQSQQRQSSQAKPQRTQSRTQSQQANSSSSKTLSKEIAECLRLARLPNDELERALFLASGKKSVYYMFRNDLIANLIKKHIFPNSNELLLPIRDNHPPSEAWRLVATYAEDIRLKKSRGESFEDSMTLLNQQLKEAKFRHGEELYSNRSRERATARDKTYKKMVEEREEAERVAAEAAERAAAEREAAEREAEREAARKRQATSRIARLASYLAGKTRAEAEATTQKTAVPPGYKFKQGERVQCRDIYSKFGWEYGTVMTVNPLTVKSDKIYGIEGFEGTWDEVRPVPPSIMSRLKTAFNRPKTVSVKVGGKRKQTKKRRKS